MSDDSESCSSISRQQLHHSSLQKLPATTSSTGCCRLICETPKSGIVFVAVEIGICIVLMGSLLVIAVESEYRRTAGCVGIAYFAVEIGAASFFLRGIWRYKASYMMPYLLFRMVKMALICLGVIMLLVALNTSSANLQRYFKAMVANQKERRIIEIPLKPSNHNETLMGSSARQPPARAILMAESVVLGNRTPNVRGSNPADSLVFFCAATVSLLGYLLVNVILFAIGMKCFRFVREKAFNQRLRNIAAAESSLAALSQQSGDMATIYGDSSFYGFADVPPRGIQNDSVYSCYSITSFLSNATRPAEIYAACVCGGSNRGDATRNNLRMQTSGLSIIDENNFGTSSNNGLNQLDEPKPGTIARRGPSWFEMLPPKLGEIFEIGSRKRFFSRESVVFPKKILPTENTDSASWESGHSNISTSGNENCKNDDFSGPTRYNPVHRRSARYFDGSNKQEFSNNFPGNKLDVTMDCPLPMKQGTIEQKYISKSCQDSEHVMSFDSTSFKEKLETEPQEQFGKEMDNEYEEIFTPRLEFIKN